MTCSSLCCFGATALSFEGPHFCLPGQSPIWHCAAGRRDFYRLWARAFCLGTLLHHSDFSDRWRRPRFWHRRRCGVWPDLFGIVLGRCISLQSINLHLNRANRELFTWLRMPVYPRPSAAYAKLIQKLHLKSIELTDLRRAHPNAHICSRLVNAVALYWGQQQGGATG